MQSQIPTYPSIQQMKSQIIHESIKKQTSKGQQQINIHYSICKKQGKLISVLTHQRILIFNQNQGIIYYVNDSYKTPFVMYDKIPKPKNDFAQISTCIAKKQNIQSNIFIVQFLKQKQQNATEYISWKFQMSTKQHATSWQQLIKTKKKAVNKVQAIGVDTQGIHTLGPIHDTLSCTVQAQQHQQPNVQQAASNVDQKQISKFLMQLETHNRPLSKQKPTSRLNTSSLNNSLFLNKSNKQLSPNSIQQQNKYWNIQFIKHPNQLTIQTFKTSIQNYLSTINIQSSIFKNKPQKQQLIIKQQKYFKIKITPIHSQYSYKFQQQFLNYYFLMLSFLKFQKMFIYVPLSCIIQYKGILAFVKSTFSSNVQIIDKQKIISNHPSTASLQPLLKKLQQCTKITSQTIINNSTILTLTLQSKQKPPQTYTFIDQLTSLLPFHPKPTDQFPHTVSQNQLTQLIRPQLILNSFNRIINLSQPQTSQQLLRYLNLSLNQVAQILINQSIILSNYSDLQSLMNTHGLSITSLPNLYTILLTKSTKQQHHHIKSLLQTTLISQLILNIIINPIIDDLRQNQKLSQIQQSINNIIIKYCQQNQSSTAFSWKSLSQQFNTLYTIPLNQNQIQLGLFLSCLMQLIYADYDQEQLVQPKIIIQNKQAIDVYHDFLIQIKPKITSYFHISKLYQQVIDICQHPTIDNMPRLQQLQILHDTNKIDALLPSKSQKQQFYSYLSHYIFPHLSQFPQLTKQLTKFVNKQPPSSSTHLIILNYIKYQFYQMVSEKQFQKAIDKYKSIIIFWLGLDHPYLCDIYDVLTDFHYHCKQNIQQSYKFIKQSIRICQKMCGTRNHKTAQKYNKLGMIQMFQGNTKQARQNLQKAKNILQDNIDKHPQQYAIILNTISRLQLKQCNIPNSQTLTEISIDKLLKSHQNQSSHTSNIIPNQQKNRVLLDNYIILARGYQINGNKIQLQKIAKTLSSMLNTQQQFPLIQTILKISITAILYNLPQPTINKLLDFISFNKKQNQNNSKYQKSQKPKSKATNINQLIKKLKNLSIYQKLNQKLKNIDKILQDLTSKNKQISLSKQNKQFRQLWELYVDCIGGYDFLLTLIEQIKNAF